MPRPDGKLIHAAVRINGFLVMLNDDFPEMSGGKSMTPTSLGGTPVTIHLTVTDVDAKFQRALDAGATEVMPLDDQFWGDRYGMVRDPFGHHWSLGQPVREVSMDEIAAAWWAGGLIQMLASSRSRSTTRRRRVGVGAAPRRRACRRSR